MRQILLCVFACGVVAGSNIAAGQGPCKGQAELLKHGHMNLGVRIGTSNALLAKQFRRALDFWASVLDMEWHEEDSDACSLQLADAQAGELDSATGAQADCPDAFDFRGWIGFNRAVPLSKTELYYYSVHEIGHLLGLEHNGDPHSVMFFEDTPGPERLEVGDLAALAKNHKLRRPVLEKFIPVRNRSTFFAFPAFLHLVAVEK